VLQTLVRSDSVLEQLASHPNGVPFAFVCDQHSLAAYGRLAILSPREAKSITETVLALLCLSSF
jgi:hypothetical protein